MAREVAASCRRTLASGGDPIAARNGASIFPPTFGAFADQFLEAKGPGWRNEKHRAQWKMTLDVYAAPMRRKPVDAITTEDVLSVLKPIWTEKPETASRLRGRIEAILDWAAAKGIPGRGQPGTLEGPARGTAQHPGTGARTPAPCGAALSRRARVSAVRDRARLGVAALALEFAVLTAAQVRTRRSGAHWDGNRP